MNRREFVFGFASIAAAWSLAARAQQPRVPVIGVLSASSPTSLFTEAFARGLMEAGYLDRHNVRTEYRWANGDYGRIPDLAAALVAAGVDLLVTFGTPAARAARAATIESTPAIPVIFATGSDPIAEGFVARHHRPGGNMTGVTNITGALASKRLELVRELLGPDSAIAMLTNPDNPLGTAERIDAEDAAGSIGRELKVLTARTSEEIDRVFAGLRQQGIGALIIGEDTFFFGQVRHMAALAARYSVPTIAGVRDFAVDGGLMSYGTSISEVSRQAGVYAGRILKGNKPSELPVLQPIKFELVVNANAARAIGVDLSPELLAVADEVIE